MPAGRSGAQGGLERRALLAPPPRCLRVSLRPAGVTATHSLCAGVYTPTLERRPPPEPRPLGPTAGSQPFFLCPLPHSETFSPGIETREGEAAVGSSLISSHGRKWRGGGPGRGPEWQAWREGQP